MIKKIIFLLTVCLVSINSYSAEGAFSLLNVEARDVDKYVEVLKNNTQIFEALGSVQAGVCITRNGSEYDGQMFVYNAYNNLEEALGASELYDPYKASLEIERLRKIKYSATFKPLVDFVPRDGFHQLFRLKLNSPYAFAEKMKEMQKAINEGGHNIMIGVFAPIASGPEESEMYHLRMITDSGANTGKILDEYFDNAAWSAIWADAQQYVDERVNETIEACETIYTK